MLETTSMTGGGNLGTQMRWSLHITMVDFEEAAKMVQPSLRREGFSYIPDVTWDDVGGLDSLRKEFDRCIVRCIRILKFMSYLLNSKINGKVFKLLELQIELMR